MIGMKRQLSIKPPKHVKEVLKTLEQRGFQAYLVGGCVRDMLLGRQPGDWDVTTDAAPEQVIELFAKIVPTGLRHGTVTVVTPKGHVEVTTFRSEGAYDDHRRPESVSFIPDLDKDLARRDFTMNAIAVGLGGDIVDPYGGYSDIQAGVIRCVGCPRERFAEDALRMFRAVRLAAKLGFSIEGETEAGIRSFAHLAETLSAERIRDEVEKVLLSDCPQMVWGAVRYGLMDRYLADGALPEESAIAKAPKNKWQRWTALCMELVSAKRISSVKAFLELLRLDNKTVTYVGMGVEIAKTGMPEDRSAWKVLLWRYGVQIALCAAAAGDAAGAEGSVKAVKAVLRSGECFSLKHLSINGDDLLVLGYRPGVHMGAALETLLAHVIDHPADNKRSILIAKAAYLLAEGAEVQ